jgi:hypothetical protein
LRQLLAEWCEIPVSLLQVGPEAIPLGADGAKLRLESGPLFEDRAALTLEDCQPLLLFLQFPSSTAKPLREGVQNSDEAPGVADGIPQDLILPRSSACEAS